MPFLRHENEVIGAYATTGARLKLYSCLHALNKRASYCDTNSVFYILVPLSEVRRQVGDITKQLGSNEYTGEFV